MLRPLSAAVLVMSLMVSLNAPRRLWAQDSLKARSTVRLVSGPEVGRRAPSFRLPWANRDTIGAPDQPYDLSLDRGKTVVLAFYPRDFTDGCAAQLRTFAEQYDSLFGPDVVVVGISIDSLATHRRFATTLDLPFRLLSDPGQDVARRYASHGGSGAMRRTVYVVGPDGLVRYRNIRFNALDPSHYAELGAAVRRSSGG